jgi:hypothetical protein
MCQERDLNLRVYVEPNISRVFTLNRVFQDQNFVSSDLSTSRKLFFGAGVEVSISLLRPSRIGGGISYVTKGYTQRHDLFHTSGGASGSSFRRTDLSFFEWSLFLERKVINNKNLMLLVSFGAFFGSPAKIFKDTSDPHGRDAGLSFAVTASRNSLYTKLGVRRGLQDVTNEFHSRLKTSTFSLSVGYLIFH